MNNAKLNKIRKPLLAIFCVVFIIFSIVTDYLTFKNGDNDNTWNTIWTNVGSLGAVFAIVYSVYQWQKTLTDNKVQSLVNLLKTFYERALEIQKDLNHSTTINSKDNLAAISTELADISKVIESIQKSSIINQIDDNPLYKSYYQITLNTLNSTKKRLAACTESANNSTK